MSTQSFISQAAGAWRARRIAAIHVFVQKTRFASGSRCLNLICLWTAVGGYNTAKKLFYTLRIEQAAVLLVVHAVELRR